jgi:pantothenate kinase
MDGYHIPRSQLDAEGIRRRGASFTFGAASFQSDLLRLKQTRAGSFPAFDHAEKDPRPNAIEVTPSVPLVIVEGNYLLMREWQLEPLFDLRVFLDCDLDTAMERVALRHLACGISQTEEEARDRALNNDRLNALEILADGCRDRADLILPS